MNSVIVVLGATGTGKSKLAIELCKALGGEVINADAVQCYQGLPIMTNKATEEETSAVPHHLLGFVDPITQKPLGSSPSDTHQFDVHEWTKLADTAVEDIHKRGKVPVVVGGTHYYIESLIWRKLIDQGKLFTLPLIIPINFYLDSISSKTNTCDNNSNNEVISSFEESNIDSHSCSIPIHIP